MSVRSCVFSVNANDIACAKGGQQIRTWQKTATKINLLDILAARSVKIRTSNAGTFRASVSILLQIRYSRKISEKN